jgi:hypothetical protein
MSRSSLANRTCAPSRVIIHYFMTGTFIALDSPTLPILSTPATFCLSHCVQPSHLKVAALVYLPRSQPTTRASTCKSARSVNPIGQSRMHRNGFKCVLATARSTCAGLYLHCLRGTLQSCSVPPRLGRELRDNLETIPGRLRTVCGLGNGCQGIIGAILRARD